MQETPIRILLIEDDEDDYILIRRLLSEASSRFQLDWVSTYDAGLKAVSEGRHDVYLIDYRLGDQNGLGLLRAAMGMGCTGPIIFLTGAGSYGLDMEAMRAGAADYLVKDQVTADLMERSIRYALDRKQARDALQSAHDALEARVKERTAELAAANVALRQEIEERKQAQEAIARAKQEWERTFDTVPDLIAIIDQDFRIVRVNKAMADRTGSAQERPWATHATTSFAFVEDPLHLALTPSSWLMEGSTRWKSLTTGQREPSLSRQPLFMTVMAASSDPFMLPETFPIINGPRRKGASWRKGSSRPRGWNPSGHWQAGLPMTSTIFWRASSGISPWLNYAPARATGSSSLHGQETALRAKDLTQRLITFSKGGAPIKRIVSIGKLIMNSAGLTLGGSG